METLGTTSQNAKLFLTEKVRLSKAEFSGSKIEAFDEDRFEFIKNFVTAECWHANGSINVFEVAGTRHPDYQEMTWIEFLDKGKRMGLNLSYFEDNRNYYLGEAKKEPTMSYLKLDGKLYIDADGNHRTCISRFFFYNIGRTHLHGVEVREYVIDEHLIKIFEEMEKNLKRKSMTYLVIRPYRTKLYREDTAGWMKERFDIGVKVKNLKTSMEIELRPRDLPDFLNRVNNSNLITRHLRFDNFSKILR